MPPSVLTGNGGPSDAFYDQFSTIIRIESRLNGDHSEDVMGPARQRWVVRHAAEVAQAQAFTPHLPAQGTPVNVHAREFTTPPYAQTAKFSRPGHTTPWYENFNLADQGVQNSSGPYRPPASVTPAHSIPYPPNAYRPFDPAEQAAYRAAVQAQLFPSYTQQVGTYPGVSSEHYYHYNAGPFHEPTYPNTHFHGRSTPPSFTRYPSTPPNQPTRHDGRTPSVDSIYDLISNSTLRANTEPIAQSARMSSLAAPDHYELIEVSALEVRNGDFIQSVKNPGTRSIYLP